MITDEGYKRLFRFFLWCLLGCVIAIIGISNVFADTTIDTSSFINVTGRKWTDGTLEFTGSPNYNNDWLLNAYNVTGGIYTPPTTTDYVEFLYFEHNTSQFNPCNSSSKFTANFKLLFTNGNFMQYVNNVKWGDESCSIQERNTQNGVMTVNCVASPSSGNYTDIFVYFSEILGTNSSNLYISRNIGITCGLNTDAIINNDNANTQNIINNNTQNTQEIINNQNQNTQDIIDSNKVCEDIDTVISPSTKDNFSQSGYLYSNGTIVNNNDFRVSDYISIAKDSTYVLTRSQNQGSATSYCLYKSNQDLISCTSYGSSLSINITPSQDGFIRFSGYVGSSYYTTTSLIGRTCKNGNQVLNDSINSLDDTLKDDNVDDNNIASSFEDFNDFLDDNSTITQLITLPITLYTAILNNLNGTCSPFNLGALYGENLVLPCINVSQYLGSSLWNMIDIIISGFAIFAISKKMIKVFNNFSSLREGDVIDD